MYFLDPLCNLLHGDLDLGDQDCVCTCSHTGVQGDPTDVAAHDLCDHAAVVRFTGGADAVHCLGCDGHCGVEAEGVVGCAQIVVDGLGNTDDGQACVCQTLCACEGAFTTDSDDCVDAVAFHHDFDVLGATVGAVEGVGAGGTDDGAALGCQAADLLAGQVHVVAFNDASPAIAEADEFVAVLLDTVEHGAADDSVQAGAVAAGSKQTDLHIGSLLMSAHWGVVRAYITMTSAILARECVPVGRSFSWSLF